MGLKVMTVVSFSFEQFVFVHNCKVEWLLSFVFNFNWISWSISLFMLSMVCASSHTTSFFQENYTSLDILQEIEVFSLKFQRL